jgi:hypothetical protein
MMGLSEEKGSAICGSDGLREPDEDVEGYDVQNLIEGRKYWHYCE